MTQTTDTLVFTKKAFGEDKEIEVKLDEKGLPIILDENDFLILGIPPKFFRQSATVTKEESRIALLEYKVMQKQHVIDEAAAKIEEAQKERAILLDEIDSVKEGKPSKLKIAKEKERLLAKLAKLEEMED